MISSDKITGFYRGRPTGALRPVVAAPATIFNDNGEEIFRAGQVVQPGTYHEVDSHRIITLEVPGPLPPSFDGRRAEYCRVERPWADLKAPAIPNNLS